MCIHMCVGGFDEAGHHCNVGMVVAVLLYLSLGCSKVITFFLREWVTRTCLLEVQWI
jgi:hypothetical protein